MREGQGRRQGQAAEEYRAAVACQKAPRLKRLCSGQAVQVVVEGAAALLQIAIERPLWEVAGVLRSGLRGRCEGAGRAKGRSMLLGAKARGKLLGRGQGREPLGARRNLGDSNQARVGFEAQLCVFGRVISSEFGRVAHALLGACCGGMGGPCDGPWRQVSCRARLRYCTECAGDAAARCRWCVPCNVWRLALVAVLRYAAVGQAT